MEGSPNPSLSVDYYKGWAYGVAQTAQAAGVKLLPAVYGAEGDSATWTHLAQAVSNGAALYQIEHSLLKYPTDTDRNPIAAATCDGNSKATFGASRG